MYAVCERVREMCERFDGRPTPLTHSITCEFCTQTRPGAHGCALDGSGRSQGTPTHASSAASCSRGRSWISSRRSRHRGSLISCRYPACHPRSFRSPSGAEAVRRDCGLPPGPLARHSVAHRRDETEALAFNFAVHGMYHLAWMIGGHPQATPAFAADSGIARSAAGAR